MHRLLIFFAALWVISTASAQTRLPIMGPSTLGPQHAAVIYNKKAPNSKDVALAYIHARGIAPDRLVGLDCSIEETITRKEFNDTIQEPLRRIFADREWWTLQRTENSLRATRPRVRLLVLIHGMPLRISRDAQVAQGKINEAAINEASVDSELMLLGAFDVPIDAALNNPYFKKQEDFSKFRESSMFLVGRIDAADAKQATRLATESVEVENSGGPWGRAVIDLYGKGGAYKLGDDWLLNIFNDCWAAGIPAQVDRHPWTIPDFYPMTDCALYYGWYDGNRNGFLSDPNFRFRKGAIAVHLHSFSALSLRDPNRYWVAPIIAHGAAATLGNVWEPYLQLTHHFDQFNAALLQGYTLAEAAGMSIPVMSWMNIVVGDPLYRPFITRKVLTKDSTHGGPDAPWMAVRVAMTRWKSDHKTGAEKLRQASERTGEPILRECAGLLEYKDNRLDLAMEDFIQAGRLGAARGRDVDVLRYGMLQAECLLAGQKKSQALQELRALEKKFAGSPNVAAVTQHINRLDPPPPPPPPAVPPKDTAKKTPESPATPAQKTTPAKPPVKAP